MSDRQSKCSFTEESTSWLDTSCRGKSLIMIFTESLFSCLKVSGSHISPQDWYQPTAALHDQLLSSYKYSSQLLRPEFHLSDQHFLQQLQLISLHQLWGYDVPPRIPSCMPKRLVIPVKHVLRQCQEIENHAAYQSKMPRCQPVPFLLLVTAGHPTNLLYLLWFMLLKLPGHLLGWLPPDCLR